MNKFNITDTHPTPLLQDFHTFLEYLLQHQPIVLTTKAGHLPPTVLAPLNAQLQCKHKGGNTPKSKQTKCYLLHLFFHLGVDGGFFSIEPQGKTKRILAPNPTAIQRFNTLNPTEQYIYLLQTLLVDIKVSKLNVDTRVKRMNALGIMNVFKFLFDADWEKQFPGRGVVVAQDLFRQRVPDLLEYALYFSWFGFWEVSDINQIQPYMCLVKDLELRPLGLEMVSIIYHQRPLTLWHKHYKGEWLDYVRFEASVMGEPFDEEEALAVLGKAVEEPFYLAFVPLFEEEVLREDSFTNI